MRSSFFYAQRIRSFSLLILTTFLFICLPCFPLNAESVPAGRSLNPLPDQTPELLTYDELVYLADHPDPEGGLGKKVKNLFETPFISNEAARKGVKPHAPYSSQLGRFIRVMSWNIEKSMEIPRAISAFTSAADYTKQIDTIHFPSTSPEYNMALSQRSLLDNVDILILQEMDLGVKRSDYRDSPKELAQALGMNYAYAPAYLEIDKTNLGIESFINEDGSHNKNIEKMTAVDPARYKGLFGSAVLSRYPIIYAQSFPLEFQGYDWYEGEKRRISLLERSKRTATEGIFLEKLMREMKVGGRNFFRVDLYVPEIPEKRLTVINVHLEIKCVPKARQLQMREILDYIRDIRNPVILMGDFNLAPRDLSPLMVKREARRLLTNPTFWFSQLIRMTPQGAALDLTRLTSNLTKNFQNPMAKNIPIIAPNPTEGMFKLLKNYRFNDGYVFDFRGNRGRAFNGKKKLLANSNERDKVGFKMTWTTDRTIMQIIGKYRLDWAFVKPYILDPAGKHQSYKLAPHFGRTLEEMNDCLYERISDHHPNVIDLPIEEPPMAD